MRKEKKRLEDTTSSIRLIIRERRMYGRRRRLCVSGTKEKKKKKISHYRARARAFDSSAPTAQWSPWQHFFRNVQPSRRVGALENPFLAIYIHKV